MHNILSLVHTQNSPTPLKMVLKTMGSRFSFSIVYFFFEACCYVKIELTATSSKSVSIYGQWILIFSIYFFLFIHWRGRNAETCMLLVIFLLYFALLLVIFLLFCIDYCIVLLYLYWFKKILVFVVNKFLWINGRVREHISL